MLVDNDGNSYWWYFCSKAMQRPRQTLGEKEKVTYQLRAGIQIVEDTISLANTFRWLSTTLLTHWSYCSLALSHQFVRDNFHKHAEFLQDWGQFCKLAFSGLIMVSAEWWVFEFGVITSGTYIIKLRHNEHRGVSKHRHLHCLLNHLFRRRSKETSKLRVTGLCEGNSSVTGESPAQRADAENVSIWWRHHDAWIFEKGVITSISCSVDDHEYQYASTKRELSYHIFIMKSLYRLKHSVVSWN